MTTTGNWLQTAASCALGLVLMGGPAFAAMSDEVPVRHQRSLWPDKSGVLAMQSEGLQFTPREKNRGKGSDQALLLTWDDIQQLTLTADSVTVVTYQDQRWQLGRDKHFQFSADLPAQPAETQSASQGFGTWSHTLRQKLGDRLILAIASETSAAAPLWSIPAKRNGFPSGAEGKLSYDGAALQFASSKRGESRYWPLAQIETATLVNARELIIVAPERAMADQGGRRSFTFQLKQPLKDADFRDLWRAIESAHGRKLRLQPGQ